MSEYPSTPRGPSDDYLQLLRGEIDAPEYVKRVRDRIALSLATTTTRKGGQ